MHADPAAMADVGRAEVVLGLALRQTPPASPAGAAHHSASRPSSWWLSRYITNDFWPPTKNVGEPWLSRSWPRAARGRSHARAPARSLPVSLPVAREVGDLGEAQPPRRGGRRHEELPALCWLEPQRLPSMRASVWRGPAAGCAGACRRGSAAASRVAGKEIDPVAAQLAMASRRRPPTRRGRGSRPSAAPRRTCRASVSFSSKPGSRPRSAARRRGRGPPARSRRRTRRRRPRAAGRRATCLVEPRSARVESAAAPRSGGASSRAPRRP